MEIAQTQIIAFYFARDSARFRNSINRAVATRNIGQVPKIKSSIADAVECIDNIWN